MKLFLCPVILLIADLLSEGIHYANIYQPLSVGLFLALLVHVSELFSLRKGALWVNDIIDFITALVVIHLTRFLYPDAAITVPGSLFAAFLLTVSEHFQHLYLMRRRLTGKT